MKAQSWIQSGLALATCLVGFASAQQAGPLAGLDELLGKQKNMTIFRSYLKRYPQVLAGVKAGNSVTILAPDDTAMNKIPSSILKSAFETNDTATIVNALQYHVLKGTHPVSSLKQGILEEWESLSTDQKFTTVEGGQRVTTYKTSTDEVTFITGLGTRCTLLTPDLTFGGGVVHSIDSPLIPPQDLIPTSSQYNLVALQGALFTANLTSPLTSAKGVTIFAPINDAFKSLGPAISQLTIEELSSILSYHVVLNETVYATDLKNASSLTTSSGAKLSVLEFGNKLFINTAQITEKDILLKNGVMHAIDTVLNPSQQAAKPNPELATQTKIWASASSVEAVPFTSAIPCSTACEPTGTAAGGKIGAGGSGSGNGLKTTSSRAGAFAARETGMAGRVVGVAAVAVLGGAMVLV